MSPLRYLRSRKFHLVPGYFRPGTLNAYPLASLLLGLTTILRVALGGAFIGAPFIMLFPVIVATAMSGIVVGLFSVTASAVLAWYFFLPPQFRALLDHPQHLYVLLVYLVIGCFTVILIGTMRTAIEKGVFDRLIAAVVEKSPDAILVIDLRGRIVRTNQRAIELLGYPRGTLTGMAMERLVPERFRAQHAINHAAFAAAHRARAMGSGLDLLALRADGTELSVDIQITPVNVDDETLLVVTIRDLTEHLTLTKALEAARVEKAVLEERQRGADELRAWSNAFQHARVAMGFAYPGAEHVGLINPAYAAAHGLSVAEAQARPLVEFYAEEDRPRLADLFAEADRTGHVTYEAHHLHADGSTFPVEMDITSISGADGTVLYRVGTMRDLTDSRRAEYALRQAAKMEAIGTLTGGLAHDFNNLLSVIVLNLDVAQRFLVHSEGLRKLIVDALASARSGAALIRSLLAFAREQRLAPTRIALNDQISATYHMLSRILGDDIEIEMNLAPGLWPVTADPSQVEACLVNLAANARDAMPSGGILTIATSNRTLDAGNAQLPPSTRPGDFAMLTVTDTGVGMTAEVVAKVFEPFFTTKEPGKGTGLGLSMVFGFATQSGGHITVGSEPGVGTTFSLFLPRAPDVAPLEAARAASALQPVRGNGEVILVVEDNAAVRETVVANLAHLNYRPLEAASAPAALALLEIEPVTLVFSDVMMPGGMDGFELRDQVAARWPAVRVLLTSGYLGHRIIQHGDGDMLPPGLLGKPYDLNQLARAINDALVS